MSRKTSGAPANTPTDEIHLPPDIDWRTTDTDEINRRILRAREEKFHIRNLSPAHRIFSDFEVQSQSGMTYQVEIAPAGAVVSSPLEISGSAKRDAAPIGSSYSPAEPHKRFNSFFRLSRKTR
jgi:hypothetical protein